MDSEMKTCTACSVPKPISEFSIRTDRGTLRTKCKRCVSDRTGPYSKRYYAEKHKDPEWRANLSRTVAGKHKSKKEKFLSDFMANPESRMALYLVFKAGNEKEKARLTKKRIKYWVKKKQFDPEFMRKHRVKNSWSTAEWVIKQRVIEVKEWSDNITNPKFRIALLICALKRNASLKRPLIWRKPTITPGKPRKTKAEKQASMARWRAASMARIKSDPVKLKAYKERQAASAKKYLRVNREKLAARLKEKKENNPAFRLAISVRSAVGKGIKRATGNPKIERTSKLIGCSFQFLVKHLESQFQTGMAWSNFGKLTGCWSIDHIRPLASFDLNEASQRHEAFSYTNLQPKWHVENISKSSNWNGRRWSYYHHKQGAIKYA